jgi:hypothetical protein
VREGSGLESWAQMGKEFEEREVEEREIEEEGRSDEGERDEYEERVTKNCDGHGRKEEDKQLAHIEQETKGTKVSSKVEHDRKSFEFANGERELKDHNLWMPFYRRSRRIDRWAKRRGSKSTRAGQLELGKTNVKYNVADSGGNTEPQLDEASGMASVYLIAVDAQLRPYFAVP